MSKELETWLFFTLAVICTIVVIFTASGVYLFFMNGDTTAGAIGDFVGGTFGTIFTLISVLLILITLHVQRKEIANSKKDIEYGRLLDFAMSQTELSLHAVSNLEFKLPQTFNSGDEIVTDLPFEDFHLRGLRDEPDFPGREEFKAYNYLAIMHNLIPLRKISMVIFRSLAVLRDNLEYTGLTEPQKFEILRVMAFNYACYFGPFFETCSEKLLLFEENSMDDSYRQLSRIIRDDYDSIENHYFAVYG